MKSLLYIGSLKKNSTSHQRYELLKKIIENQYTLDAIDVDVNSFATNKIIKSIGWRFKKGPFISIYNKRISSNVSKNYDVVWLDKGDLVNSKTLNQLRNHSGKLIHFTLDNLFYTNRNNRFTRNLNLFDYVITTKTFEVNDYLNIIPKNKLVQITQAFNYDIHKPMHSFEEKSNVVCFIGLYEKSRGDLIQSLVDAKIKVVLAGKGWRDWLRKNKDSKFIEFKGEELLGSEYVDVISSSRIGLGLMSKKFPELHTTRTFEIPAIGTILATEKNIEINNFFNDEEVLFYSDHLDLTTKIKHFFTDSKLAKDVSIKGRTRVLTDKRSYQEIMQKLVNKCLN